MLCEAHFFTRMSTRVAMRSILSRACLLLLPEGGPITQVIIAVMARTGPTWLDHARMLTAELGVHPDCVAFCLECCSDRSCALARGKAVWRWKRQVVLPRLRFLGHTWFTSQLDGLPGGAMVPYSALVPARVPFRTGLWWAP